MNNCRCYKNGSKNISVLSGTHYNMADSCQASGIVRVITTPVHKGRKKEHSFGLVKGPLKHLQIIIFY